jgi:hypothetical protein
MKLKIFYIAIFLVTSINLYSQIRDKGTFEITPKIGKSVSNYYVSGNRSSTLSSINFGISGDFYLNNRWSLNSGLLYQRMGGKTYAEEYDIDYLNIPVNANWHFGSTRKWNLNFGFAPSFKIGGKNPNILNSEIKNSQIGITLGIGYKIKISNKLGIMIDYQFFSGMTNISNDEIYDIKNKNGNFNIGMIIKL